MAEQRIDAVEVASAPLRHVRFWSPQFDQRRTADGVIYLRQSEPLGDYPSRIIDRLEHWAAKTPDAIFLADRGPDGNWRELTYAGALASARRLGQALLDAGLSQQKPLLILSGNDLEHARLALACFCVGVPYAALSEAYSLVSTDFARLQGIVGHLEPGLVFAADGKRFARAIEATLPQAIPVVVTRNPARPGTTLFADMDRTRPGAAVDAAESAVGPDTIAKFLFTSGSTGSPKAVINTNRMICANQAMVADCFAFLADEPPVVLDWAPWSHTAGGNKVFFMVMFNGGTLYIDDGRPTRADIHKTLRNLMDVSPTWYFNVPLGFEELVHAFEADPALRDRFFSRLRMLMYAGAGLAQHTWDDLQRLSVAASGERVLIASGLGATETAPFALMCTFEAERAGNVGLPAKGLELKLVPVGDKLEARLRGPSITPGYWKEPELTAAAFDDEGFYNLGDALRFADPDDVTKGLYFDGRTAENFKLRSGTWVATGSLRTAIINHFGGLVRDVALAGLDEDFIAALAFPDLRACQKLAGDAALEAEPLLAHPKVRAAFAEKLASLAAASTGSSNRVRRMILLAEPPRADRSEVTDKGSINQRAVLANRPEAVAELYAGSPRVLDIGGRTWTSRVK